jgi:hypothetical protein
LLPEAVAAVHWAIASGLEGYFGLLATLGTDRGVHLSGGLTITAAVTALASARLTAGRTALGLVSEALFGVIGLVFGAESEGLVAVLTGESPILVAHSVTSFPYKVGKGSVTGLQDAGRDFGRLNDYH